MADPDELDRLVEEVFWMLWVSPGSREPPATWTLFSGGRWAPAFAAALSYVGTRSDRHMGNTILLVEDNDDNQEIYRIILAHHGYHVLQAFDGGTEWRWPAPTAPT